MKKRPIISMIAVLAILATMFCACGTSSALNPNGKEAENTAENIGTADKSLEQYGMDVINLMDEMLRSDEYLTMMTSAAEFQDIVEEMRTGDYAEPENVYKIAIPNDVLGSMLQVLGEDTGVLDGMSDTLYKALNKKVAAGMVNQLNAQAGVTHLALTSIFTANKVFVSDEADQDYIYLYTFENGYPIVVTFTMGEGGAVTASGSFFMNEEISFESVDEVKSLLEQVGITSEIVAEEAVTVEEK